MSTYPYPLIVLDSLTSHNQLNSHWQGGQRRCETTWVRAWSIPQMRAGATPLLIPAKLSCRSKWWLQEQNASPRGPRLPQVLPKFLRKREKLTRSPTLRVQIEPSPNAGRGALPACQVLPCGSDFNYSPLNFATQIHSLYKLHTSAMRATPLPNVPTHNRLSKPARPHTSHWPESRTRRLPG